MMVLDNKFEIGSYVYLKTDPAQEKRIVTGFNVRATSITYMLSLGANESYHYEFEISDERCFINV